MERRENIDIKEIIRMSDHIEPDHELLVWEKWIKIRQEETTRLGKLTKRPPADLTMNLLEKIREDKEWKVALEHAQIKKKPSLRGGLWEQPLRLKQACFCQPIYEVQRTAAEKGTPAVIEHIGVPDFVQEKEKGLTGEPKRKPCVQLDADYVKYRKDREERLEKKIKRIDPFRPLIGELIVRGGKPKTPVKKLPPSPNITITEDGPYEPEITAVYAIRINNTIIYKDIPGQNLACLDKIKKESWHEECTSWTYYFKVPIKRAGRCKLYLKNLGTVTLRYCWKKLKKTIPFIPEDIYEQVFFFNKNEDVISPGQSKVFFFTFVSDKPEIFSEFWELSFCNICFFDTLADKIVVNLYADSIEDLESLHRKVNVLKSRIDIKAVYNIVRDMVDDAVTKASTIEPQIYPYKKLFLESEMFLMKNPVCYYHQTEVMKMKDLYTEMVPGELWDLSITSWRAAMMDKLYDERMKYFELLRKSHSEMLKPWYEGESVLNQKYRAMKWLLGMMADKFDAEYERLLTVSGIRLPAESQSEILSESRLELDLDPRKVNLMRNLFYMYAYEHVVTTIEMCAGVLSSIDLNRWIEFDFCRF
ncbi:MYCBP-associated protein-like [Ostrinia furnacalis]|uniref:MYCBP-associated protein-like n=1 Tax=Ostrinia furnacalis TaxID=93504 RepID=UPI00103A7306|nr:MYCBP-associated protein-like [Ostrinia furnacalis]